MAETRKKPFRWGRFLLIWAAALLAAGLIGCVVLYFYLGAYERSLPEPVMDALMAQRSAQDWLNAAEENLDFEVTPFEDAGALYLRWRESLSLDGALSYRQVRKESSRDKAVFAVRCGASNLCTVELIPGEEKMGFGLHDWALGRISSGDLTAGLNSAEVEITALTGETVLLNGIPVDESYAVETDLPVEALSSLEARYAQVPRLTKYRVGPLFGAISVTDAAGQELSPRPSESRTQLSYSTLPDPRLRLTVSAPADVTVVAGGVTLDAADVQREEADLLAGLEEFIGEDGYRTRVYALEGLLSLPEVRAIDADGKELVPAFSEDGHYVFLHAGNPEGEAHRLVAETFFRCYHNYLSSTFDVGRYAMLLRLTLPGTELYNYFARSQDTMYWAIRTNTEFRDLEFDNFYAVGENCFVCTIRYDAGVSGTTWVDAYSHEDQNTYELVFVRRNGTWLAAAMTGLAG